MALALAEAFHRSNRVQDPFVAEFDATLDSMAIKKNAVTIVLSVEWEDRHEVYRVVDETPMVVKVRIEKHHG